MNATRIGNVAGTIGEHLQEKGPDGVILGSLKKVQGLRADEVVAAVG